MRRRGGLGRGLDALIPSSPQDDDRPAPQTGSDGEPPVQSSGQPTDPSAPTFDEISIDRIDPNPRQPREAFDEELLQELTNSIEAVGVLQPIVVRPTGDRFQIVMGERRSGPPRTTSCSGTPSWRTSTVKTSVPSRRRPPTSSYWPTSRSRRRSWPVGSDAAAR
jgi:hypothetical protein